MLRTALMMVVTTNLKLAVLWAIAKFALAICTTFLAQIARSRACPILKVQIVQQLGILGHLETCNTRLHVTVHNLP